MGGAAAFSIAFILSAFFQLSHLRFLCIFFVPLSFLDSLATIPIWASSIHSLLPLQSLQSLPLSTIRALN